MALLTRIGIGLAVAGAFCLALLRFRRSARRAGRKDEKLKNRARTAERAVEEGERNAERLEEMSKARADGPHSRDDVLERLRNGDS